MYVCECTKSFIMKNKEIYGYVKFVCLPSISTKKKVIINELSEREKYTQLIAKKKKLIFCPNRYERNSIQQTPAYFFNFRDTQWLD